MAKKGWDNLSPGYRERLERKGLSKQDYEEATSLKKYRGHEHTPEKPKGADPVQYPKYFNERDKLIKELMKKKEEVWGDSPKWNKRKAKEALTKKEIPMALLRKAMKMTGDDWLDAIREDHSIWYFLGYK
jgi:hypothetical protein